MKRETVFSNEFCELVAKTVTSVDLDMPYYSLKVRDYVAILAVTEHEDILLVRLYRPTIEEMSLELPAGLVEDNEDPEKTAKRELLEETGYIAHEIEYLGCLNTDTGRLDNRMWCYFSSGVSLQDPAWEPEDGVQRVVYSMADLKQMIEAGEFRHALHLAALFLAQNKGKLPLLL